MNSVYSQLTEYGKGKIDPLLKEACQDISVQNRLEEDIYKNHIFYLLKSSQSINITYTTKKGKQITRKYVVTDYKDRNVQFKNVKANVKITRNISETTIAWGEIEYH